MALDYMDLKGQLRDIVTVTFTTHSNLAAKDLVTWFERGYDFVLDASVSEGEIEPGIWLVFVEMERRSKVPSRICTLLADLETLTDIKLDEWSVDIEGDKIAADEERIREKMILNPNEYKAEKESDEKLNEFRELAGIETKRVYHEDEYTKNLKAIAGM
jgi:hypothetical protein